MYRRGSKICSKTSSGGSKIFETLVPGGGGGGGGGGGNQFWGVYFYCDSTPHYSITRSVQYLILRIGLPAASHNKLSVPS